VSDHADTIRANEALGRLEARKEWDEADLNDFAIIEARLGRLERQRNGAREALESNAPLILDLTARCDALENARTDAERILTPPMFGGERFDDAEWQLARIQWHHDHGDKERADRMLRDLNAVRRALGKPELALAAPPAGERQET
jgi:hypothetical protein